ncbi:HD domain-containing protein [Psychrobacter sp. DM4]|uniref:HD domain-containing protein n=1 Tax=Psychrobacter sp. DM4 TaxID=3440637 RepID=UPI003F50192E
MSINIPNMMERILKKDSSIHSFTLASVSDLKPWLDANTTVFFPEYTDHSFIHLNEVLATAESIITDESWDNITPEDVSAMIISVLLHDCAMHITEDGFYSLIRDTYPPIKSQYVSEEPKWSVTWSDYIAEAKRFNSDKLKSIFNDTKPVSDIPANKIELTTRDKLLIGEFVRRHHARIAHEIVFNGVPGTDGKTLKLSDEPKRHFLDLCGFIAKSHNMSLRQAVDKIPYPKRRIHLNTHVPFLMSVLRISDYIQVQATRAPSQLLNVKSLISPISKGEWKKHDAILEISHADEDPEALFIDAEPQNALIFEDLRWLFSDIQRELDEVWAVLGEVYGRYDEMSNLGINIRRLRSSLDDINTYIEDKKPDFIPKVLKFRTADSEMMELLIAPLYGDKPEIGIRELVQNAVDACLEVDDISSKQGITVDKPDDYDVCVSVIEHENYGEVIVEDYGVGMTLDIIENYFLNIGASFRNSDRWKKTHETDGRSDIHRTGRFGIGLLAAYLLGDELEVETRHISCPEHEGLKFRCSRGSKSVTISHTNCHIGTRISIKTSKNIVYYLSKNPKSWDWYCLSVPKVKRKLIKVNGSIEKHTKFLDQNIVVPQSRSNLEGTNWFRVETEGLDDVVWSYEGFETKDSEYHSNKYFSVLICNGIFINSVKYNSNIQFLWNRGHQILTPEDPTVVVYDQDGRVPLDIQRTSLTYSNASFISKVSKDVTNKLIEVFFESFTKTDFISVENTIKKTLNLRRLNWEIGRHKDSYISAFMFSRQGISLVDKQTIVKSKPTSIQIIPFHDSPTVEKKLLSSFYTDFSFVKVPGNTKSGRLDWVRNYFEFSSTNHYRALYGNFLLEFLSGSRLFIRIDDYEEICKPTFLPKRFQNKLNIIWEDKEWYILENKISNELPELLKPEEVIKFLEQEKLVGTVVHYFDWNNVDPDILIEKKEVGYFIVDAWLELNHGNVYFKL